MLRDITSRRASNGSYIASLVISPTQFFRRRVIKYAPRREINTAGSAVQSVENIARDHERAISSIFVRERREYNSECEKRRRGRRKHRATAERPWDQRRVTTYNSAVAHRPETTTCAT
ncbi:nop10 ribonucleoprotein isoform X1 [Temnothorax americanus]|uniref:nop10 ribonucleoprotein isoform X1 n=1 Tax=Temnothorax americanus TaxID=1964332 RepID=UPI0040679BA8